MVGDGMQCPPSPLLFDPSVTLDPSLRDMAEAPIDILALEEPDRGSSSTPLLPAAEGAAQVGLGVAAPSPLRDGLSQQEPPLSSRQARGAPLPPSLGVPMVWVALGVPGWGGSQRPAPEVALWVAQCHPCPGDECLGHWGCLGRSVACC